MIVDGTNMVLGRLASNIAKKLMQGEEVHLINADRIVISGTRKTVVEKYMQRRRLQNKATPEHSPKWPSLSHLLVRRMIRGMLPFKKAKGRTAFRKLKVYSGNPNLKGELSQFEDAKNAGFRRDVSVAELCRLLASGR